MLFLVIIYICIIYNIYIYLYKSDVFGIRWDPATPILTTTKRWAVVKTIVNLEVGKDLSSISSIHFLWVNPKSSNFQEHNIKVLFNQVLSNHKIVIEEDVERTCDSLSFFLHKDVLIYPFWIFVLVSQVTTWNSFKNLPSCPELFTR